MPGDQPTTWSSEIRSGLVQRPEAGHYVDLTEFFNKHNLGGVMAPGDGEILCRVSVQLGANIGRIPAEGDAVGWSYRKDWFEDPAGNGGNSRPSMATTFAPPGNMGPPPDARHRGVFSTVPDNLQGRYGIAIYTDNSYDGLRHGRRATRSSPTGVKFNSPLGNYGGPTKSTASSIPSRT